MQYNLIETLKLTSELFVKRHLPIIFLKLSHSKSDLSPSISFRSSPVAILKLTAVVMGVFSLVSGGAPRAAGQWRRFLHRCVHERSRFPPVPGRGVCYRLIFANFRRESRGCGSVCVIITNRCVLATEWKRSSGTRPIGTVLALLSAGEIGLSA